MIQITSLHSHSTNVPKEKFIRYLVTSIRVSASEGIGLSVRLSRTSYIYISYCRQLSTLHINSHINMPKYKQYQQMFRIEWLKD